MCCSVRCSAGCMAFVGLYHTYGTCWRLMRFKTHVTCNSFICRFCTCFTRLMFVSFSYVLYGSCMCCFDMCHTADVCVVLICAIRLMILFYACTHIRKRHDSCGTHENDTYMSMSMFVHRKKFMSRMAHMRIYSYLKNHLSVVFYVGTYFFNDRLHNDS